MKCIFTFATGSEVYSLAMTNNTVYGGCFDHKIRVWNLNTMQKSHMLIGHEGSRAFVRQYALLGGWTPSSRCGTSRELCTTLFATPPSSAHRRR